VSLEVAFFFVLPPVCEVLDEVDDD